MSDPSLEFHGALFKLLKDGADLGVGQRVYDTPPKEAKYPYIVIGDDQVIGDDNACEQESEVIARIHIWSQPQGRGFVEVKTIAGALRDRFRNGDLALQGFSVDVVEFQQTRYLRDDDPLLRHGVMDVRFLISPA